jgi:hypothetical protein
VRSCNLQGGYVEYARLGDTVCSLHDLRIQAREWILCSEFMNHYRSYFLFIVMQVKRCKRRQCYSFPFIALDSCNTSPLLSQNSHLLHHLCRKLCLSLFLLSCRFSMSGEFTCMAALHPSKHAPDTSLKHHIALHCQFSYARLST